MAMEYDRTTHFMRNLIGRVTYGLVGLDKLRQRNPTESSKYLDSFLSLVSDQSSRDTNKLLPDDVEQVIQDYNPKLRDELIKVATRVREIAHAEPNETEIIQLSNRLQAILNTMYETVETTSRPNR
jgi:hypothetical protein